MNVTSEYFKEQERRRKAKAIYKMGVLDPDRADWLRHAHGIWSGSGVREAEVDGIRFILGVQDGSQICTPVRVEDEQEGWAGCVVSTGVTGVEGRLRVEDRFRIVQVGTRSSKIRLEPGRLP